MLLKSIFGLLTLFCLSKSVAVSSDTNMTSPDGIYSVVYLLAQSQDIAKRLSFALVKINMVASITIIEGVTSIYESKNQTYEDIRHLMMIHTRTDTVNALTQYVTENHPYEVRDVISLPIQNGSEKYFQRINEIVPPFKQRQQ